jgi:hypothetical protein
MRSAFVIFLFIFSLYEIGPRLGELSLEGMQVTDLAHSPLSNFHSIRLIEPPPDLGVSSDICCKIRHVILDDEIKYKALSYVWGDPNITLPILVNAKLYHVTAHCHAALCRLRGMAMYHLWVDAICINQKDDMEKATQIPLMNDYIRLQRKWLFGSASVLLSEVLMTRATKNWLLI